MKKVKEKKAKEFCLKTMIVIEAIIIILLLLRFNTKNTILFNGDSAQNAMGQIRVRADEIVDLENNQYTSEGYKFSGWSAYNEEDNTWKCEEGWFTEEEMQKNEYKIITYETEEEMKNDMNEIEREKITTYATWSKPIEESTDTNTEKNQDESNIALKEEISVEETEEEKNVQKCRKHFYFSIVSKKPTCNNTGVKTYTCMMCNDTYTEEIPKLEHEYKTTITEATCEKNGIKTYSCLNCNKTYTEKIPAKGHVYIEKVVKIPDSKGKIVKLYICTQCTHQYEEIIREECLEHIYSSKITKKATCTENGIKTYTCVDCEGTYTEDIPAIGHNYTESILKEPTCSEAGSKGFLCLNCKDAYTETIAKLKHNYIETIIKEATHEEVGSKEYKCSDCKETYTEEIPKLEYTDLEKLQMALIGRQFSEEDIGQEMTVDGLEIKSDRELYFNETEILNEIEYNGNKYIVHINQNGIGIDVTEKKEAKESFKFDEWYSGIGDMDMTIKINKNGDVTIYETSTIEFQGTQSEYAKVYQNNIYFKEDGIYYWIGSVNETGIVINIGTGEDSGQLIYNPDFDIKVKEFEEQIKNIPGYYEYKGNAEDMEGIDAEGARAAGFMIEEKYNYFSYICVAYEDNKVMPIPLLEMYVEPGNYTARLEDGNSIQIINPIFYTAFHNEGTAIKKHYALFGYVKDNKVIQLDVEFSDQNNYSSGSKVYKYTKIEEGMTFEKTEFPCDKLKFEKVYEKPTNSELTTSLMGINKLDEKSGVMYMGADLYGKTFWYIGAIEFTIKEDFIAEMTDGTTMDFSGKQVIYAQEYDEDDGEILNTYKPFGYIDGNTITLINARVAERDENGNATKYNSIEIETEEIYTMK